MENIINCNKKNVATVVLNACYENQLNLQQCYFWLTDNIIYISVEKGGAIAYFNLMTVANSFRISCGLHEYRYKSLMLYYQSFVDLIYMYY